MPGIMVPKSTLEDFSKPRANAFPEGTWIVTLEEARERPFPDFIAANVAAGKNTGYASGDGETLGLQFGAARDPKTGETTNQKLFVDIVTRDGDVTIDGGEIPGASWQMANSAALLLMIAQAVGAAEEVTFEGKTFVTAADGFLDALKSGEYAGTDFGVTTYHRKWKTATKEGVEVKVREIFQAV